MNLDALEAAGIACGKGIEHCMGNRDHYERMLKEFREDPKLEEALMLYRVRDDAALQDCVMEIRGVCGNLGMQRIAAAAVSVTEILRKREHGRLPQAMEELESSYRSVLTLLNGESTSPSPGA
jgi:hypothetical protein